MKTKFCRYVWYLFAMLYPPDTLFFTIKHVYCAIAIYMFSSKALTCYYNNLNLLLIK